MTPPTPDIEFRQIRVHGSPASRAGGFEELSSLLIMDGIDGKVEWPAATKFDRFGNPDGGREGRGVLPNGEVWAWQSKYLFEFTDKEVAQVEKSVKRAFETEPDLKKYVVTLPYDLPAGDTTRAKGTAVVSAFTRWEKKKAEWEALAAAKDMDVSFVFVGQSELTNALTSEVDNAGRIRYWFGASVMSAKEQQDRLADVIVAAGRRYTPKLHVEVDATQALEGLGRSARWVHQIQLSLAGLRRARAASWRAPKGDTDLQKLLDGVVKALTLAELAMEAFLAAARTAEPLPDPLHEVEAAEAALDAAVQSVRKHMDEHGTYTGDAASAFLDIRKGREAVARAFGLLNGHATAAARRGVLVMTGRAGVGKTHLFCDVASRRINAGQPTVVVLGQDFDATTLLPQVGKLAQIDGNLDEVLKVLDAAGEAAGWAAMLMVDAINEGEQATRWADELPRLAAAVDRFSHVALAVSCRTEFVDSVLGTPGPDIPQMEHLGFVEATTEAVDRYTSEYGLERLAFPILNPEFGNPLFLKLACEALSTLGERRFTLGAAGLTTVIDAFLDAVGVRLSEPGRCDYDRRDRLVQKVAREVAALGAGPYARDEVKAIAEVALPGKPWSQSLFAGLVREGVFMETRDDRVFFAYQRLGDILRSSLLAEGSSADVQAWFSALKPNEVWVELGVIGALAVIVPEKFDVELPDLLADDHGSVVAQVADAFLESLALRSPADTTDRTAELAEKLLGVGAWRRNTWAALLRVACVPGHATNAGWTHKLLLARPMAERDATWSEWLVAPYAMEADNPVEVLLNWAWPVHSDASDLPVDVAHLACLMLGWMLTTPNRRVRNQAAKAMVAVGERNVSGFAEAVKEFRTCDDPYVIEGLTAAICAVTLRASDPSAVLEVAEAAKALVAAGMPTHLVSRDYLRRTAQVANQHGWNGPTWEPPYGSTWPVESLSSDVIKEMTDPSGYRYSSIWTSLTGMLGDFGSYILKPAILQFAVADHKALQAEGARFIFSRAVEFGWTPERFGDLEQGRRFLRGSEGVDHVERYGKKYQWISLHELLARLTDNFQLTERWDSAKAPFDYSHLEELLYRDIDPTVLVRPAPDADPGQPAPWFAPVVADFPDEVPTEYPSETDAIPDPLDLIAHTNPTGVEWLALTRHANWTQELAPEVEALNAPNLHIWMQIRSYLIPTADLAAVRNWAAEGDGTDYDGRWMPEEGEVITYLLGTHPDSPDWDYVSGEVESGHGGQAPPPTATLQVPFGHYGGTGAGRDTTGSVTGYVPSRVLSELLHLNRGKDFAWTDAAGLAVVDPTAGMDGSSVLLMRRDLADVLDENDLTLMWTVLLNKELRDHDHGGMNPDISRVSASATYVLEDRSVELVSSTATHRKAGDFTGIAVPWSLRSDG